jgi:hypothetical protein
MPKPGYQSISPQRGDHQFIIALPPNNELPPPSHCPYCVLNHVLASELGLNNYLIPISVSPDEIFLVPEAAIGHLITTRFKSVQLKGFLWDALLFVLCHLFYSAVVYVICVGEHCDWFRYSCVVVKILVEVVPVLVVIQRLYWHIHAWRDYVKHELRWQTLSQAGQLPGFVWRRGKNGKMVGHIVGHGWWDDCMMGYDKAERNVERVV